MLIKEKSNTREKKVMSPNPIIVNILVNILLYT